MGHDYSDLYIGGRWATPASSQRVEVRSPANGSAVGSYPESTEADVDAAVSAAALALHDPAWRDLTLDGRADLMERLADAMERRSEERSILVSNQNGMPVTISRLSEGSATVGLLRYYASLCRSTDVEERRPSFGGEAATIIRKEPVGVVAAIAPWNYPVILSMFKLGPALATGCAVVLKPSPETTLDSLLLAEAAEEVGLPPGVINVVTGGAEIGQYLVAHPSVDKVAFTGSTRAGRQIGEICGRLIRPVTLELGGKSAALILDDADPAATAEGLSVASLMNTGQTCYLSTRILAPEHRYDEFLDAITGMASSLPLGDPLDEKTYVGPLVSRRQRERVESYIEAGRSEGARVTTGGGRPAGFDGYYIEPTVFGNVDHGARVAREEIFGPVLSVIPYRDDDEAVALANDSEYGLGGTVWTADQERGIDIARRVETGSFGVNGYTLDFGAPFGGVKSSGVGRELGPEGMDAYWATKSIYLPN